jgi:hypothetical protein
MKYEITRYLDLKQGIEFGSKTLQKVKPQSFQDTLAQTTNAEIYTDTAIFLK